MKRNGLFSLNLSSSNHSTTRHKTQNENQNNPWWSMTKPTKKPIATSHPTTIVTHNPRKNPSTSHHQETPSSAKPNPKSTYQTNHKPMNPLWPIPKSIPSHHHHDPTRQRERERERREWFFKWIKFGCKLGCSLKLQLHLISFNWMWILTNPPLDPFSFFILYACKISRKSKINLLCHQLNV